MGQTPRVFSREFILSVVRAWDAGETSCAQLCREHRLQQSLVYRWREAYRAHGEQAFTEQAQDDYQVHPLHLKFVEEAFKPSCAKCVVYDFE